MHLITFLYILSFFHAAGQDQATGSISLQVSGLRNDKGHVLVSVFNSAKGFPGDAGKAIRKYRLEISDRRVSVEITDLPPGGYAIALLHDENNDTRMNTNGIGWPKEGFGFSNNAMGLFGPPSFSKAKFTVSAGRSSHRLKMRYY